MLRNHIKWARIKVRGDGTNILKEVPGAEGNFVFIKDSVYKKPDILTLPFPTYFAQEDEDVADLEPLMADLGDTDPFMAAD
uniref:50S ribosomal protein L3-2, chloroplastic n=1 Tax=Solanum tuberosum TaxID=4113 RepID=M1B002_SOLTU